MGRNPRRRVPARRSRSECCIPKVKKRRCEKRSSSEEFTRFPLTLPPPIKSPNDYKEYKVIQLANGLTAVLISDMSCSGEARRIRKNQKNLEEEIVRFNSEVVGVEFQENSKQQKRRKRKAKTKYCSRSSSDGDEDSRKPKHALDCICKEEMAGISLSVGVGDYSEPHDIPGLAHLCEHVMLAGSSKYPGMAFDAFLSDHMGSQSNAETWGAETVYHFGVPLRYLPKALDIFANLFIEPAMDLEHIIGQREAVDAEFHLRKDTDVYRILRLFQTMARVGEPESYFSLGSKGSLVTGDGNDETLQKRLREFQKKYGSESMILVVQATDPLDRIEELVVEPFGEIPRSSQPSRTLRPEDPLPHDTDEFRRFYNVIPVSDSNMLIVTWEFPVCTVRNYGAKPLTYLMKLLESLEPGGLTHFLKAGNLSSSVETMLRGPDGVCGYHSSHSASVMLSVIVNITKDFGKDRICRDWNTVQILEVLFSYLKFLETQGLCPDFFNEFRWIESLKFHFAEPINPVENSAHVVQNFRDFKAKDCLIGELLPTKWEPEAITSCLKLMTPANANYMMVSKGLSGCEEEELYFETIYGDYSEEMRLPELIQHLTNIGNEKKFNFSMPKPNEFVTTKFYEEQRDSDAEIDYESEEEESSVTVVENEKLKFVNSEDKMALMYASYKISLTTSVPLYSVQANVLTSLWSHLLGNVLSSPLHGAVEAHLFFSVKHERSEVDKIEIQVNGLSQKLELLLEKILEHVGKMDSIVDKDTFESEKLSVLELASGSINQAPTFAAEIYCRISYDKAWTSLDHYDALAKSTLDDFQTFAAEFKSRLQIDVKAKGNVNMETSSRIADMIEKHIDYSPLLPDSIPEVRARQMPLGESILRIKNMDPGSNISSVRVHYQVHASDPHTSFICELIAHSMSYPAFEELRTKQNLGYEVSVTAETCLSVSNICILIDYKSDHFTATELKHRIDSFVRGFYETTRKDLTQSELESRLKTFEAPIDLVQDIKVKHVVEWISKHLLPGPESEMRKLVIQVVGYGDGEFTTEIVQDLQALSRRIPLKENRSKKRLPKFTVPLVVLVPVPSDGSGPFIRNINEFVSRLFDFPLPPPAVSKK